MKLPVDWLKKYIEVSVSADKLAELLTMSGTAVESVEKVQGGDVLDIEVTTNRPDCLSLLGLAREVAALTGGVVKVPEAYSPEAPAAKKISSVTIALEDKDGCPYYTGRLINNVKIAPASDEVRRFLEEAGTRPISNVVDATNFVLLECGQPLHAFDYDKIKGGRIIVRRAKSGEKFLGIDGVEYVLDPDTLVIADAEEPIAMAGVIGGKKTEVTDSTRTILLESAYFDPALVRKAARRYKVSTESSYRFERGVDPETVRKASDRVAQLILEWAGGEELTGLSAKGALPKGSDKKIQLRTERLRRLLEMNVSDEDIVTILTALSLEAKVSAKGKVTVSLTSRRRDLALEEDFAEEILRITGFDKIPAIVPPTHHTLDSYRDPKAKTLLDLKAFMAAAGFTETVNYSLLSEKSLKDSGFAESNAEKISNAISAEQAFFRPSLLPGLLQAAVFNIHRKAQTLKLFEVGNDYRDSVEETTLGVVVYGLFGSDWKNKEKASFFEAKGIIENVLSSLNVTSREWRLASAGPSFDLVSEVLVGGQATGFAGKVSGRVLKNWDIPQDVFYAELRLDRLLAGRDERKNTVRFKAVPKYPSVRRDLAFVVETSLHFSEIEALLRREGGAELSSVQVFDEYKGKGIPGDKRSLAVALQFQKKDGTFTDPEIQDHVSRIRRALEKAFKVEFR